MGYNTVIMLLNDGMDQLEKHPKQFVEKLMKTYPRTETEDFGVGNHCNNVTVVKSQHMDVPQLTLTYENWITPLNPRYVEELAKKGKLDLLKEKETK